MGENEGVPKLTHVDSTGAAHMVDIAEKDVTTRIAEARGVVRVRPETLALIRDNALKKGDVLAVARLAGIMAAKRTSELVPLCHFLLLTSVGVEFRLNDERGEIGIVAHAGTDGKTGVEMEALTAVTVAALTIYDMCKAVDRSMRIGEIRVTHKSGGRSGTFDAD